MVKNEKLCQFGRNPLKKWIEYLNVTLFLVLLCMCLERRDLAVNHSTVIALVAFALKKGIKLLQKHCFLLTIPCLVISEAAGILGIPFINYFKNKICHCLHQKWQTYVRFSEWGRKVRKDVSLTMWILSWHFMLCMRPKALLQNLHLKALTPVWVIWWRCNFCSSLNPEKSCKNDLLQS